jgi:uncharacterized protein HemY
VINSILQFLDISLAQYNIDDSVLFIVAASFLLLVLCYFLSLFESLLLRFFRVK